MRAHASRLTAASPPGRAGVAAGTPPGMTDSAGRIGARGRSAIVATGPGLLRAASLVGGGPGSFRAPRAMASADIAPASASGAGGREVQPASTIGKDRSAAGSHARARAPGRRIEGIRMVDAT